LLLLLFTMSQAHFHLFVTLQQRIEQGLMKEALLLDSNKVQNVSAFVTVILKSSVFRIFCCGTGYRWYTIPLC